MLAGPLPGTDDPTGPGKLLFAFFAAMAETERENIREFTSEGLDTAARKGRHGGRPPVITDDMLHTVLRRRALGESVEQVQPGLFIPTGKRGGQNPSVAGIYRALAEHAKREAYPEAVEQAHADFAALQAGEVPGSRLALPDRASLGLQRAAFHFAVGSGGQGHARGTGVRGSRACEAEAARSAAAGGAMAGWAGSMGRVDGAIR
ncbi:recombinase family protein [Streptomyces sp. NPDC056061]|uniref:recombinase family protein n=1 Tax=Streptomyces sp. NPDC056061 TaxID=3345700 RepID=UPI0035D82D24